MSPSRPAAASVVIPAFNVEEYAADAVESALAQTYPVAEVICVDDGSTDDTLKVLRGLEAAHPSRVRVLTGPNAGAPTARNRGLAEATGTWIQFLDADDLIHPDKIEAQVAFAERGEYDVVCGLYQSLVNGEHAFTASPVEEEDRWINLFRQAFAATTTMLFRREAVLASGGWTEGLPNNQDYDLVFKLLRNGARIGYDEHHATTLRRRTGSISFDFTLGMRQTRMEINRQAVEYLRETGQLEGRRRRVIEDTMFTQIRQMYPLAPDQARSWHRTLLGRSYTPSFGGVSGVSYVLMYMVLGFARTEALRARLVD